MKAKHKRLYFLTLLLFSFFGGCIVLFLNLKDNLIYFYSPTEVLEIELRDKKTIRVGGLVEIGSIEKNVISLKDKRAEEVRFQISDLSNNLEINYVGILPDLFKEGQGVIVEGMFDKNRNKFLASKVLAKHDENYMPPEIEAFLKE